MLARAGLALTALFLLAPPLQEKASADTLGLPPCTSFVDEWRLDQAGQDTTVLVVRTAAEWQRPWAGRKWQVPRVDFARNMVVGVKAPPHKKLAIYRVQVDDPASPKLLEVRVADGAASCGNKTVPGARVHLVVVPRSALPVWFVRDQMIDGRVFGLFNEGTDELELGRVAAAERPGSAQDLALREDAERLAFAVLDAKERAQLQIGPLGRRMRRVLHPWVRLHVERQPARWLIEYGAFTLSVDATSGQVQRAAHRQ
jgi:hypothetical protein